MVHRQNVVLLSDNRTPPTKVELLKKWALAASLVLTTAFPSGTLLELSQSAPAAQSKASIIDEQSITKNLVVLENRFFAHQYANDPLEKRLERVELLMFGGTQPGSNPQRFDRIQRAVSANHGLPSATAVTSAKTSSKSSAGKEIPTQYSALKGLEWRALKKTYPHDTLNQRLGRLENKLFGQESPSMAYADRVERLKKTLAVEDSSMPPPGPLGPAPRAFPRQYGGEPNFDSHQTFGFNFNQPSPNQNGFGLGDDFDQMMPPLMDGPGLTGTFSQMFRDMNKQMQMMNKLGPGVWTYDSNSGVWTEQNTGKKVKPVNPSQPYNIPGPGSGSNNRPPARRVVPLPQPFYNQSPSQLPKGISPIPLYHRGESELPPYADPNSI